VAVLMQLGARQEVRQRVVHPRPVTGADGEVVLQGNAVQLTEQTSESFAASGLSVDDVYVGAVVDVEEQ
jgi:hypothetical protein